MATEGAWDVYNPTNPDPIIARLNAAARHVDATREAYELALAQRDEVVVEAVELAGLSTRQVGRHASMSASRVTAILARI